MGRDKAAAKAAPQRDWTKTLLPPLLAIGLLVAMFVWTRRQRSDATLEAQPDAANDDLPTETAEESQEDEPRSEG